MGALLSYSITSGVIMLAMYAIYKLIMANDNQHAFNRCILLSIYAVATLLPALLALLPSLPANSANVVKDFDLMAKYTSESATATTPMWSSILLWIFVAGMAVTTIRTARTYLQILRVISSGEKIDKDGYTLVLTDDNNIAPFSWMRFMVISRQDYLTNGDIITTHELRHITSLHWIDMLIAQIVIIINWFNPAAWLMRSELMLVHEYQADMSVMENGSDIREYQLLLINKAVGTRFPSLANSLNHSKLKKRITMMYKSKSNIPARLKGFALLPAAALALTIVAAPKVKAAISTISNSEMLSGKVNEISSNPEENSGETYKFKNLNNNDGKTTVTITGIIPSRSLSVDGVTLSNEGKNYDATGINCSMKNGEATIIATFPFLDHFDNVSVTLSANGRTATLNLEPYFDGSANTSVQDTTSGKASLDGLTIYVDGKITDPAEINNIAPGDIESMTINQEKNAIFITTRQK